MLQVKEFAPVDVPHSAHLRDAVQKGLGRAIQWAKKGLWSDEPALLDACLHDLRYDRQCENARGPWLWQLMDAVGSTARFQDSILESLQRIDDGLAGQQLCQLGVLYARHGDHRFRLALQELVQRKPDPYYPSLGEAELIDLDGEAGFLFAARIRGDTLLTREWHWEDRQFVEDGIAKLGESIALSALERESQSSNGAKLLYDGWLKREQVATSIASHSDRMRQITLASAMEMAESPSKQFGLLRGWGMYAAEDDLRVVRDRLWNCKDSAVLANLLRVFSNRAMPEFDERFLALLDHPDENVNERAFAAAAKNTHPAIRKYALERLSDRFADFGFLTLFIRNYEPGDEAGLLTAFRLTEDRDQMHSLLMDLREVLTKNPQSTCDHLGPIIYFHTPCGMCRQDAVELLVERSCAAGWLIEECRHDAVEDTRIAVEKAYG